MNSAMRCFSSSTRGDGVKSMWAEGLRRPLRGVQRLGLCEPQPFRRCGEPAGETPQRDVAQQGGREEMDVDPSEPAPREAVTLYEAEGLVVLGARTLLQRSEQSEHFPTVGYL